MDWYRILLLILTTGLLAFGAVWFWFVSRRRSAERYFRVQKMEALGRLSGSIVHDFNNMLAGIRGAAEMLCLKAGDNAEVRKYGSIILAACENSSALMSRLQAFSQKQCFACMDICSCLHEAVDLLRYGIGKTIHLSCEDDVKEKYVFANRELLETVFLNLGFNACDAVKAQDGKIEIAAKNVFLSKREIKNCVLPVSAGNFVEVVFKDNGCGIPKEYLGKIFEPFFTTKSGRGGTGLGLPAVYGVMAEHKGTLRVETSANGTAFYLYFPVCGDSPVQNAIPCQTECVKAKILIVDDEKIFLTLLADMLKTLGADVLTAADGREAERLYSAHNDIDLFFIDMLMPASDGAAVYNNLKRLNPSAKVVFLSGGVPDCNVAEILQKDACTAFLRKPCTLAECFEKISLMLAKK